MASPVLRSGSKNGGSVVTPAIQADLSSPDYSLPFFHYLTIPINTAIASPIEYTLNLPNGLITRVWLEFPRGCAGLAGVQVWRGVRQIFPLPEGVWIKSDNAVLNFAFTHRINTVPNEVQIKGYNLDDTYSHTIWVGLEMRGEAKDLSPELSKLIGYLSR